MHDTWNDKYIPDIPCYFQCGHKTKGLDTNFDEYYKHQITKHFDEWHEAYNGDIPRENEMWDNLGMVSRVDGLTYNFYDKEEWKYQFEQDPEGYMKTQGIKAPKHKDAKEPAKKKSRWKLI